MVKLILLLVYLTGGGELKIEQKQFDKKDIVQCEIAGRKRVGEIFDRDPAVEGIFAGCIEAKVPQTI